MFSHIHVCTSRILNCKVQFFEVHMLHNLILHSWFVVGNFYRIHSAFKYGARKLGWILLLPEERMEAELEKFFVNTLDRHCWSSAPLKTCFQDKACLKPASGFRGEKTSGTEVFFSNISSTGCKFPGNVRKLETAFVMDTSDSNDTPIMSSSHFNQVNVVLDNSYCAPQKGFLGLIGSQFTPDCFNNDGAYFTLEVEHKDEDFNKRCNGSTRSFDDVGKLLDLCGDYDSCLRNLRHSQIRDKYSISPPTRPISPPMSPHRQKSYPWQAIHQSGIRNHNVASGVDHNGFAMGLQSNPVNHLAIVLKEKRRPQGIGTYFPRTVFHETYLIFFYNQLPAFKFSWRCMK